MLDLAQMDSPLRRKGGDPRSRRDRLTADGQRLGRGLECRWFSSFPRASSAAVGTTGLIRLAPAACAKNTNDGVFVTSARCPGPAPRDRSYRRGLFRKEHPL